MRIKPLVVAGALTVAALTGGAGIALAATSTPGSGPTSAPTSAPAAQPDTPEAGDSPDTPGQVDTPEPGDTADAPGSRG